MKALERELERDIPFEKETEHLRETMKELQ